MIEKNITRTIYSKQRKVRTILKQTTFLKFLLEVSVISNIFEKKVLIGTKNWDVGTS